MCGELPARPTDKPRDNRMRKILQQGEGEEWESSASNVYSLPVWLWKTVTLFAWLVEPLRRDWPCNIILPLSSSCCHLLFISLELFPSPILCFGLCLKTLRPRVQFMWLNMKWWFSFVGNCVPFAFLLCFQLKAMILSYLAIVLFWEGWCIKENRTIMV